MIYLELYLGTINMAADQTRNGLEETGHLESSQGAILIVQVKDNEHLALAGGSRLGKTEMDSKHN